MANRIVESARSVLNQFLPDIYIHTDHMKGVNSGKWVSLLARASFFWSMDVSVAVTEFKIYMSVLACIDLSFFFYEIKCGEFSQVSGFRSDSGGGDSERLLSQRWDVVHAAGPGRPHTTGGPWQELRHAAPWGDLSGKTCTFPLSVRAHTDVNVLAAVGTHGFTFGPGSHVSALEWTAAEFQGNTCERQTTDTFESWQQWQFLCVFTCIPGNYPRLEWSLTQRFSEWVSE